MIMNILGHFTLKKHAFFVLVPLVALALAGPAAAETKTKQPSGSTPTAQAKPAPKLKLDTDIGQPSGTSQESVQSSTSSAQPGAKGAGGAQTGTHTAQSGTSTAQQGAKGTGAAQEGGSNTATSSAQSADKSAEEKKASGPVEDGAQPLFPNPKQLLVNIDKSTQEATVFVDGVEQYNWKVSTGKPGFVTPSGTYTATSMNKIWYSKEWDNAPMPHAVFFMKDGHAIHGTTEVKNLGKPASHGCVRLAPENAAILYELVKQNGLANTQVVLSGETPGGEYKGGVASGGPQYQYPPYPYGYGYGRGQPVAPPWFNPNQQAQIQPDQQPRRRGLFRRWFQQNQGYYPPAPRYYQRGYPYGY
jgi:lipoprotein-anchoring transpeptidase ErfK/SrfK